MQKYELIVAIVNRGFSELVMDSARKKGATGGTIINARGTVVDEAQTIMGISIQPEKEIVLILTQKEKRNDIMSAICNNAGLNTAGKGIVFSLLVEDVLGLSQGMENWEQVIKNIDSDDKDDTAQPKAKDKKVKKQQLVAEKVEDKTKQ